MSLVTVAGDVRFEHLGPQFPLSLPRNTAHTVSHQVWPGDPLATRICGVTHTALWPCRCPGCGVHPDSCEPLGCVLASWDFAAKTPRPGLTHQDCMLSHPEDVVGRAVPSAGAGVCPRSPRSLLAPSLWQHRSSLPAAAPGVSTVSGRPFHKDSGQWVRAAIPG